MKNLTERKLRRILTRKAFGQFLASSNPDRRFKTGDFQYCPIATFAKKATGAKPSEVAVDGLSIRVGEIEIDSPRWVGAFIERFDNKDSDERIVERRTAQSAYRILTRRSK